jgi:alpha-mannosidase
MHKAIHNSKSVLKSLQGRGEPPHATPVASSRETRPTHWLNFSQNPKSKIQNGMSNLIFGVSL